MIVCMNRVFARLFRKAEIGNDHIDLAINEIMQGNCIPLGHKLFKKRVASRYQGKSGAYRSIVYYRTSELMVFLYLFAKNDRENITPKEMKELIQISRLYDSMNEKAVENAIKQDRLARWNYETH
jgi:hypothetical protein